MDNQAIEKSHSFTEISVKFWHADVPSTDNFFWTILDNLALYNDSSSFIWAHILKCLG